MEELSGLPAVFEGDDTQPGGAAVKTGRRRGRSSYDPAGKRIGRLTFDWFSEENPSIPLEYLYYVFVATFNWRPWEFCEATTDFVFSALEFDKVEHVTKRRLRLNVPPVPEKVKRGM